MSRTLKSFADLSLKVVAVRTAGNSEFEFEFPSSSAELTPSAVTSLLGVAAGRRRNPFAETPTWHHGGINE